MARPRTRFFAFAVAAALISATPAMAHHSPQAEFDLHALKTLKGTIKQMEFINPHGSLLVDVPDARGNVTTWQFEADSIALLNKKGIKRGTLTFGKKVDIVYYPARSGKPGHGFLQELTLEDGQNFKMYFGPQPQK